MTQVTLDQPIFDYDEASDVMYVELKRKLGYEYEVSPGVFLRRSDSDDEIIGATILKFSKKDKSELSKAIHFDFVSI